jgi:cytoskeletal protein CcmA (bactofilin family)
MWPWKRKRTADERSVIGSGLRIRGEMESEGELEIRGQVVGNIVHAGRLVVAAGARCDSLIRADELVVAGEVHGHVVVQGQLELLPTGRLYGDATCGRLVVAPGALLQGSSRMAEGGGFGGRIALPPPAGGRVVAAPPSDGQAAVAATRQAPLEGPLAILLEPVGEGGREPLFAAAEPEVLVAEVVASGSASGSASGAASPSGVSPEEARALRPEGRAPLAEAPAFYGGFSA